MVVTTGHYFSLAWVTLGYYSTVLYDDGQGSDGSYGSNKCVLEHFWCVLWWFVYIWSGLAVLGTFRAVFGWIVGVDMVQNYLFLTFHTFGYISR